MNNPSGQVPLQGFPPLSNLVKPEQVSKMTHWDEPTRNSYIKGITGLYQTIQSRPPESAEYQNAYRKLIEASTNIRNSMRKHQAEQSLQQNGTRSLNQAAQDSRQQAPHPTPQQQPTESFSQKVIHNVQIQKFLVPPHVAQEGDDVAQSWLREAKQKYAQHLQKCENGQLRLQELGQVAESRRREGKPFSPEEVQTLTTRKQQILQSIEEAKNYLTRFKSHQDSIRAGGATNSNPNANGDGRPPGQNIDQPQAQGAMSSQPAQQQHTDLQGQPHTVTSALDAARSQGNASSRSPMSPQNAVQSGQSGNNQGQNPPIQGSQAQQMNSHPTLSVSTGGVPQQPSNSLQNPNPPSANSQVPYPLSYRAAMAQAAQSYAQPNFQQSTPQSSTHAHPQIGNRDHIGNRDPQTSNSAKMPIPKDLKVPQPVPVSMGLARPTLTGGPSGGAGGPLGQPAIQKHPGYVLEGDGERVLSKKKLEELVRQVTGGSGTEGEEGESISADVEESLLQIADDFVDQVILGACRLAKLRQSSTLELRDIQLILERNYNIRVPGYASDELRTVRKIQPAQGWTQKMSAVQAAKVTGGKTDV